MTDRRRGLRVAIAGILSADTVEGGCVYLETAEGLRFEVVWPPGWRLDRADFTVRDAHGRSIARGGEPIRVRGIVVDDLASPCQAGTMIRAEDVSAG